MRSARSASGCRCASRQWTSAERSAYGTIGILRAWTSDDQLCPVALKYLMPIDGFVPTPEDAPFVLFGINEWLLYPI